MMNRRDFLKAVTALCGSAAVPAALVEACQINAPIPNDWEIKLLDINGNVVDKIFVASLDKNIVFPMYTGKPIYVTHFSACDMDLHDECCGALFAA